jgi:hypothetical protein
MRYKGRVLLLLISIVGSPAFGEEAGGSGGVPDASTTLKIKKAPPAPLGIFGSDINAVGKFSVAASGVFTGLANSRIGTRIVSPEYIVSTTPWFFDPAKPVRLVPSSVFATIQTLSISYGVAENLGIVLAAGAVEKRVSALTYAAPSGARFLGSSYASVSGVTDMEAAAVLRIYRDDVHRFLISLGITIPTGSNERQFRLLLSDGTYGTVRAFYSMQPGTGTFDFLPGFTYGGALNRYSWGIAYRGRWPLAPNPEGYRYGDLHDFHGWVGYTWIPEITTTIRVTGTARGPIRGYDPKIDGKSQSANPYFYGGQRVELYGGATIAGGLFGFDRATLAVEAGVPIYQNLNGPQLFRNWQAITALRISL